MKESQTPGKAKSRTNPPEGKTVATMVREAIITNGYKDVKDCARAIRVPYDLFNKVVGGHIPKDSQLIEYAKKLKLDRKELLLAAYREKAPAEMKPYLNAINLLEDHSDALKALLKTLDDCNSDQIDQLLAAARIVHATPRETSRKALALLALYQQLDGELLEHFDSLVLMALRNSKVKGLGNFQEAIELAKATSTGRSARLHQ